MAKEIESIFRGFNIDGAWYCLEETLPEIVVTKTVKALSKMFESKEIYVDTHAD